MKIWALVDSRIGSSKQTESLAYALSSDVSIKRIEYNKFICIPNFLRFKKAGIDFSKSSELLVQEKNVPDMIIFGGRRLAGLALYLQSRYKRKFNKNIKLVSILNPNYSFKKFDYVVLPAHDSVNFEKYNNIIKINGSICKIDDTKLQNEMNAWHDELKDFKRPYYVFMVGGDIKNRKFNAEKLGVLINNLSKKINEINGTLFISTSRRTSKECIEAIKQNLKCLNYFYEWNKKSIKNPYYAFLANSDVMIITGDSISMISESLTIKKPTFIYAPDDSVDEKHMKFIDNLVNEQLIKIIDENADDIEAFTTKGLNELEKVKNNILGR